MRSVDVEDLNNQIRHACSTIIPAKIRSLCTRTILRRFVESEGAQFEHLLIYYSVMQ